MKKQLQDQRKKHKMTQQQIADYLGIQLTTYQKYERDVILPPTDKLEKLADFYNVSTDYLLGRTEKKALSMTAEDNKFEEELLEIYRSMPEEYRKLLYDNIRSAVLKNHNEQKESEKTPIPMSWAVPPVSESKAIASADADTHTLEEPPEDESIFDRIDKDEV